MFEQILTFLPASWIGGGLGVIIVGYVLKRIPNEKIKLVVGKFFYGLGVTVTLGLAKWPATKSLWNKTIEPYVVDLIDNVLGEAIKQFIAGLRSDNVENSQTIKDEK